MSTVKYQLVRRSYNIGELGLIFNSEHESIDELTKAMESKAGNHLIANRHDALPFKEGEVVYCRFATFGDKKPEDTPVWGEYRCVTGWGGIVYAAEEYTCFWDVVKVIKPLPPTSVVGDGGSLDIESKADNASSPLMKALISAMSSVSTSSILGREFCHPLSSELLRLSRSASTATGDLSEFKTNVDKMSTNLQREIDIHTSSSLIMKTLASMQSKLDLLVESKQKSADSPSKKESMDNRDIVKSWYESKTYFETHTNRDHWILLRRMTNEDLEWLYKFAKEKITQGRTINHNLVDCVGQLLYKIDSLRGVHFIKAADVGIYSGMYNYCFHTSFVDTKTADCYIKRLRNMGATSDTPIRECEAEKSEDIKAWCHRNSVEDQMNVSVEQGSAVFFDCNELTADSSSKLFQYAANRLESPMYALLAGMLASKVRMGEEDTAGKYFRMAGDAGLLLGMHYYLSEGHIKDPCTAANYIAKLKNANY
jgi:hypothetical protein